MKKLAITSENADGLDANVAGHFGGAPFFTVITLDDGGKVESVRSEANPHATQHTPGAVPRFVRDLEANVVITGGMGQRARQVFAAVGIEVRAGRSGTVREALNDYLAGKLPEGAPCHHHDHDHQHGGGHRHGGGHGHGGGCNH